MPVVNYLLIAICTLVFFKQLDGGQDGSLIERYGMVPARVLNPDQTIMVPQYERVRTFLGPKIRQRFKPLPEAAVPNVLTLVTCMFLHGGWIHFIGNMWFLFIFGDNVEDRLGHLGYGGFYLGCGILSGVVHLLANTGSAMPTVGASGAIAAVMGGYFLLYPRAQVLTLVPIFFFFYLMVLPAPLFLGFWFFIQFFQGTLAVSQSATGGVAWWAHIGGFIAGFGTILILLPTDLLRPPVRRHRPVRTGRWTR